MRAELYSRMLAEGRIHGDFRRSHRWQRAVLGVSLAAGALAGVHEATDGEHGIPWKPMLEVTGVASILGETSRIMTRSASNIEVTRHAIATKHHPADRHYKTIVSLQGGKMQERQEYDEKSEIPIPLVDNFYTSIAPITVFGGTLMTTLATVSEQNKTAPQMIMGGLITGAGILLHARDHRNHMIIEGSYDRQLDNIDSEMIFELDSIE